MGSGKIKIMEHGISYYVQEFRKKKSIGNLYRALRIIIKEGRFMELLYGFYCFVVYRASKVKPDATKNIFFEQSTQAIFKRKYHVFADSGLTYNDYLKATFGEEKYAYHLIPEGFRTRIPSVYKADEFLLLGEYGHASGRLAILTKTDIKILDYYNKIKGFRHIHCISKLAGNDILINTGDDKKYLDQWTISGTDIAFKKRLVKTFGGFTAAAEVKGEHYFGSDFSKRPNYIYRLSDRKKFFYPEPAFTMFVMYFEVLEDRYILTLSMHIADFGGKAVTVFDTQTETFVYAEALSL